MTILAVRKLRSHCLMTKIAYAIRKVIRAFVLFKPWNLLSDDIKYNIYYHRSFIPDLYKRHASEKYSNCLFCRNLIKSELHKYCLICSKSTYNKCYLPLPGLLYEDLVSSDNEDILQKPWYFMKTCSSFERLPQKHYSRNLHFLFSSITIQNYEVLEGLENGVSSDIRPCYVCASVDYELYKKCKRQDDYDICSPCPKVKYELGDVYDLLQSHIKSAG